jgi:peptidoglycan/LPS O-acetylase OafA/YrhL
MIAKRLELIDFLKGYSIFTIVVYHLLQRFDFQDLMEKGISFGGSGIHVFILCSGFGLYLSHLNKPMKYGDFLKRRFFKVYLPFIMLVFLTAAIPFTYTGNDRGMVVLSNVFLFRMFNEHYINAFGGHLWFVSMILEFYLFFPILSKAVSKGKPLAHILIALLISVGWSIVVVLLGKTGTRIWDSFFLQFLWEFVLGMEIAKWYKSTSGTLRLPTFAPLLLGCILGIGIMGYTGMKGGTLILFNDIPTLFGYLSLSLLIYSLNIKWLNHFFIYTCDFSYEWFLTHILLFSCTFHFLKDLLPFWLLASIALVGSYFFAIGYHRLMKRIIN